MDILYDQNSSHRGKEQKKNLTIEIFNVILSNIQDLRKQESGEDLQIVSLLHQDDVSSSSLWDLVT